MAKKKKQTEQSERKGLLSLVNEFKTFLEESRYEMKKVTYPTQKQTLATCGSVLFLSLLMALFLGVVDVALAKLIATVLH